MRTTPAAGTRPPHGPSRLRDFVRRPAVWGTALGLIAVDVLVAVVAGGHLPFDQPRVAHMSVADRLISPHVEMVEVALLMMIVYALTRRRPPVRMAERAPAGRRLRAETYGLLAYGAALSVGGLLLGHALGYHAISFHLDGTLFGTTQTVTPAETFVWAAYNVVGYALLPYLWFRRRYSSTQLNLKSANRRGDLLVIVVVLVLEGTFQLTLGSHAILELAPRQIAIGAPLTFGLYFLGTVLPTMVFVYAILLPRLLRLSGSVPATVVLGGLTYAGLHFFDGWTVFATPRDAALSVAFVLLTYAVPGMFKSYITLRTGNAWAHVWAYHAIAPHTLMDTPLIVKIFHIGGPTPPMPM